MPQLVLLNSISDLRDDAHGDWVVSGSHGGTSAAAFVLRCAQRPALVCFNDAGVGKEGAGIAALVLLQAQGVAAVAYSHESACIGSAQDAWTHGRISAHNAAAQALGAQVGQAVSELAAGCGVHEVRSTPG